MDSIIRFYRWGESRKIEKGGERKKERWVEGVKGRGGGGGGVCYER